MGLGQAGVRLFLFALMAFCEAQRRMWETEGASGALRDLAGLQPRVRKPAPAGHGPQAPAQPNVSVRPQQRFNLQPNLPPNSRKPVEVQFHQQLQGPVRKVTWRFPQVPLKPTAAPVPFQMREPVSANSVAAECGEKDVYVEVKQDFFGNGLLLMPSAITLGGCGPSGQDVVANVLMFRSELQACNSIVKMTEDELIYSFVINVAAEPHLDTPITREDGASVYIECHYLRKRNVSSNALLPTWIPYAATKVAEERLMFSLRLMTDDWKYERPSSQYYLGDVINIEASVTQYNHVPLHVLVDRCIATPVPDVNAVPSYSIIENHGCLVDAKVTGSSSYFMPQDQHDKLQFQLEAFKFYQDKSGLVYITCYLMATKASAPSDAENKACSYSVNRWTAAFGDDQVCRCCDTICSLRKGRDVSSEEFQISLRPLSIEDPIDSDLVQSSIENKATLT
ncbi:zona pellucida sperm-binding protein 3-like [Astyanax mexicanus]|uniref:Zona pellucida sperm-binding protein 3 n=1 Tax=Astyanax mexicanus TaxID=7994 RepID=A0A8T2KYF9_ASTMX|nr:zona pellucida sperm-binding protein 3-like [Astyanax mexicanus]